MALASGTKLGPYEIQSLLGAGGMGEVYRARDTRLQRDVAIKILPNSLAHDRDRLRRFEQEARAVAALNHPNLLTVFDVGASPLAEDAAATGASSGTAGTASESPFIVSELLEGTTLRDRLASGALRERKAVDYAIQIARGLAAAHERGIVHRDLKPENLFVTNDGRVKILDFGLAKLTEAAPADSDATLATLRSATQAGVVMGTIGYMSHEQVRGKAVDPRSDIFSRVLMVFTPEHPEGRDFTWMDWVYGTRFSLDGKQILFGDEHAGPMYGTFLRNLDGTPAVRLGDGNPDDLSPDGAWATSRLPLPPVQITLLPTGTGEPRQLTHSKINHTTSRWLPDGRLVADGSEAGHTDRAYLIDTNGNETPITPDGIRMVAVSSDGKRMVTTDTASHFQLFPIGGGEPQLLTQLQKDDRPFDFTLDDAALLVRVSRRDGGFEIWRVELAGAKRTLLHAMNLPGVPAISSGLNVTASRDGKSYAYQHHPAISTEYLVEGLR
jgi:hypothetical protein